MISDAFNEKARRTVSHTLPPNRDLNPDETNAFFANELNKLTIKERDEVLQDVHGVSDTMDEESEFVDDCLQSVVQELSRISDADKRAYLLAKQKNPQYVNERKFLLMFLRANLFDASNAASRIVSFFQAKLELFGPEKLGRDIMMNDLNEEDIACFESGYCQVLGGRDRAGRAVFFLLPKVILTNASIESKLRSIYLLVMKSLEDAETQKKGWVGVAYNVGRIHSNDREAVWKNAKLMSYLPIRFQGIHYCYDDPKVSMLFAFAMFVFEKNARIRCRLHCGSDIECIYNLMTFGIPSDALPILPTGEVKKESHQEFIRRLRKREEVNDNIERLILPGTYDVLLGRGKPLQKHPGNLRYHLIIEDHHSRYENATKLEKTTLSKNIVQEIKASGGRFLKQSEAGWIEIDDDAARYKVSHTFRNHRIAKRASVKKASETILDDGVADNRRKHHDSDCSSDHSGGDRNKPIISGSVFDKKKKRYSDASRSND